MKIQNSSIALAGESRRIETYSKEELLKVWVDKNGKLPGNSAEPLPIAKISTLGPEMQL